MANQVNLFFPQWQGSGINPDVYNGGVQLLDHIGTAYEWQRVAVSDSVIGPTQNGIIGYQSIVDNLNAAKATLHSLGQTDYLFTLGGDCGIEVAPIAFLNEHLSGDLVVLWIDGHGDLNTPESSPSATFHGMPLRVLLGEGDAAITTLVAHPLRPEQIAFVGVRDLDAPEQAYITAHRIPNLEVETIRRTPAAVIELLEGMHTKNVYLHVDIDILDPSEFSSAFYPTPGGLMFTELTNLIDKVKARFNVVGAAVTECKPMGTHDLDNVHTLIAHLHPNHLP